MITRRYLAGLIGITIALVILAMTTTLVMADSPTDGDREGMVYETLEAAEAAAIKNGCSGYHEFDKDGKVWYMPDC